jgi:trehalose synthase-fused probable maltokinase
VSVEAEHLRDYLPTQRWFGAKGRMIESITVLDEAVLDDGPPALELALVRINLADGPSIIYSMPLLVENDGAARDSFEDIDRLRLIGELMAHGHAVKGSSGTFYFGGAGLDPLAPPGNASIRAAGGEQSNTSAVLDEDVIVKFFRRVEPGPNPDLELNRQLTNEGFINIPAQVGEISYEGELDSEDVEIDLGIAQRYIAGATDGWTEVLRYVHALFDEIHPADAPEDRRLLTEERSADVLERLERLGDVTAAMHVALSREEMEPDLAPEPISESDRKEWAASAAQWLEEVRKDIGDAADPAADRITLMRELEADIGLKTRIHADYHLGQVLYSKREWLIIDFEGEPARPLEERRMKVSPLKDAAGMLRSFSYAALVTVMERAGDNADERARLEPWADAWETLARERFLTGYLRTAHEGHFLPPDRDLVGTVLEFFELDKALYEVSYERGHRPHWVMIPLKGIENLLKRGEEK